METTVDGLARAQAATGMRVRTVTLGPGPEGMRDGVEMKRLPRAPGPYAWARGLLSLLNGKVIHVHGVDGLLDTVAWSKMRSRTGLSTHGGLFHTSQSLAKRFWLRTVTRQSVRRIGAIWYTSLSDRAALGRHLGREGPVIGDGVDLTRFGRIVRRPEKGRWLLLGRVDVHKGIDDLLKVVPEGVRLEIVGPERAPALSERLRRLAREHAVAVTWRGALSDAGVDEAMSRCELAIFPSRYEGFGVSVIEAMAAGVPCVVSKIPAFDRLVEDGVDAYQIDFQRADARAELAALGDLACLIEPARSKASGYSWSKMVDIWNEAYAALASNE